VQSIFLCGMQKEMDRSPVERGVDTLLSFL